MNKLSRILTLCLAAAFAFGASIAAKAQELKIGFLAPRTGIIAQVGKDMVNGFQMYLDEHGGKLGGANVKFIVEDDQAKPDRRRHQGQEADPAGQCADVRRRRAGLDRLRAGAGVHRGKDHLYPHRSRRPTISPSARPASILI